MIEDKSYAILTRRLELVNTDPQRRCYNGCNYSSAMVWTAWSILETGWAKEAAERRLKFCPELNEYSISQKGEKCEFKVEIL